MRFLNRRVGLGKKNLRPPGQPIFTSGTIPRWRAPARESGPVPASPTRGRPPTPQANAGCKLACGPGFRCLRNAVTYCSVSRIRFCFMMSCCVCRGRAENFISLCSLRLMSNIVHWPGFVYGVKPYPDVIRRNGKPGEYWREIFHRAMPVRQNSISSGPANCQFHSMALIQSFPTIL